MNNAVEKPSQKPRILRWRGLLGSLERPLQWAVGIVLAVTSAVLAFTQLGFVGIDLPDGRMAYVVVLLPVVALGALLLGTLAGTALGLTAGALLYAHSQVLPLDHFELAYVTPVTSIVMLGVAGFILGILFAFVLRHNPSQVKRIVYIAIVVVLVAWAYSICFGISTFATILMDIAETFGDIEFSDKDLATMANAHLHRLGSIEAQALLTAALAALACCVADYVARRIIAHQGTYGLRAVFGAWLSVAVALGFMALAATSFIVTTDDQLRDAEKNMSADLDYLCKQMEASNNQTHSLADLLDNHGIAWESMSLDDIDDVLAATGSDRLLQNYDQAENGTVVVTFGPFIDISNSSQFTQYDLVESVFSQDMMAAVERSMQTGELTRFVYDGTKDEINDESIIVQPYIAYMLARSLPLVNPEGEEVPYTVIIFQDSTQVFQSRGTIMQWLTMSSLILMVIVSAIVYLLLNRLVARRIDEENTALESITAGNLDTRATAGGTREFESLTGGINNTVDALKGWIAETETRMDAELATAKAIQESALPRTFPPFPDLLKFDIYASMQPAKQVGGDFYDFFLIGEESDPDTCKLAFVVADVSGKGVPAALFMMKSKALIRDYVGSGMELGEAISEANRQICDGNDAGMFVTAWIGVLDYNTGHVDYVNAGHNPPLLWSFAAGGSADDTEAHKPGWNWLTEKSGLPLGLFEGLPYTAHSLDCLPGETFILYSDGVTEAMDVNEELYGEDRLMALAKEHYLEHPRELLESVKRDVAAHAAGAVQSDDITVLTLEVGVPPEVTATLEVPAETAQIHAVNDFLHAELDRRLCPKRIQSQLDLVIEELFVNVCHYAYADTGKTGTVKVQRTYSADPPCVKVKLIDEGVPFDPLAKPDVELPTSVDDLAIGGLGIFMVKNLVDDLHYERVDDANVVTILKKW